MVDKYVPIDVCPKCASVEVDRQDFDYNETGATREIICDDCGHRWFWIFSFLYNKDNETDIF